MALLIRLIMALFTRPEIGLFHPTLTLRLPQPEILEIKDLLMEPYISYGLKIIVLTLIISLKRGILFY